MKAEAGIQGRVGTRLRELRTERGLSVRSLAARSGLSPSFISQIESEVASLSIGSLQRIAAELGVTLGEFFSSLEPTPRTVVRRDERPRYESAWSRSVVEVLVDGAPGRRISAVQVTVEPGGSSGSRAAWSLQDAFVLVLSGELLLVTTEGETELRSGDTAYHSDGPAFGWENRGSESAILLLVGVPGRAGAMFDLLADDPEPSAREGDGGG